SFSSRVQYQYFPRQQKQTFLSDDHHELKCLILLQKSHRVLTPNYETPRFVAYSTHLYFTETHLSHSNSAPTTTFHSLCCADIFLWALFQSIFVALP